MDRILDYVGSEHLSNSQSAGLSANKLCAEIVDRAFALLQYSDFDKCQNKNVAGGYIYNDVCRADRRSVLCHVLSQTARILGCDLGVHRYSDIFPFKTKITKRQLRDENNSGCHFSHRFRHHCIFRGVCRSIKEQW